MGINTGEDELDARDAKKTNSSLHKASGLLAIGYKICPYKRGTYLSKQRIQDGAKATSVSKFNFSVKRIFAASSLSLCKECSPSSIPFFPRKRLQELCYCRYDEICRQVDLTCTYAFFSRQFFVTCTPVVNASSINTGQTIRRSNCESYCSFRIYTSRVNF